MVQPIVFPNRSNNITKLDLFVWGVLKLSDYYLSHLPHDRVVLKDRIQEAITELNEPHTIREVQ